jgi:Protein of unknown function (DUF3037)
MPEQHLFEYAVVRIVPQVEREEFLNVGVVLYCSKQKFLQFRYCLDKQRLAAFSDKLDIAEVESYLQAFERICAGSKDGGAIAKLPIGERFRWLTATRSTVVQSSKVHPGLCDSASDMLEHLYKQMVL